jgi:hypothetical protein
VANIGLALTGVAAFSALAISVAMAQTPVPSSGAVLRPTPGVPARGTVQIRCWQYGRLVLEESLAQPLAEGGSQSIRLQGADGSAAAVTLLSTGSTTCLVKPSNVR